jgi:hypothetical protein
MKPRDSQLPEKPKHDHPWKRIEWGNVARSNDTEGNKSGFKSLAGAKAKARKWLEASGLNRLHAPKVAGADHVNIKITKDTNGDHNIEYQNKYCEACAPERIHTISSTPIESWKTIAEEAAAGRDVRPGGHRKYAVPANPTETPPPHRMDA